MARNTKPSTQKKTMDFPVYKITTKGLAELFGLTERTVQNYVKDGMPRIEPNVYDVIKCLIWYIGKLKTEITDKEFGEPTRAKFDLEERQIKIAMQRIALSKAEGKILDVDVVRFGWLRQVKIFVNNIDALAPRLNNIIGGDRLTFDKIKQEIKLTREQIANDTELDFNKDEFDIEQPKEGKVED